MTRNGKWTTFGSGSVELSGNDATRCVYLRKHLAICVAWIEPTWAGSNEASETWHWSTSKRSQEPSGFHLVNCSAVSDCDEWRPKLGKFHEKVRVCRGRLKRSGESSFRTRKNGALWHLFGTSALERLPLSHSESIFLSSRFGSSDSVL